MDKSCILITGANGYLGTTLAKRLFCSQFYENKMLLLCVHAENLEEFAHKSNKLKRSILIDAKNNLDEELIKLREKKLKFFPFSLSTDDSLSCINSDSVEQIIHCAAATRFNLEKDSAFQLNVLGSKRVFDFANSCKNLTAMQVISTIYASGLQEGNISEMRLEAKANFANYYENSKWQAEELLFKDYSHLPANILRIATIIADSESGVVFQQNAFHNTLKLFYFGLLSLLPGNRDTTLYFVTNNFVIEAIESVMRSQVTNEIFHICHTKNESLSLEEHIENIFIEFSKFAEFQKRRILPPLWSDFESFDILNKSFQKLSSGIIEQALSSIAPFSKQLFVDKDMENNKLREIMPHYLAPDQRNLIRDTARYMVSSKWQNKF